MLSREEIEFNTKHSSNRILPENYCVRMGQLWSSLPSKYLWSESIFDLFFAIGIAFDKFHIFMHKLRDDDNEEIIRYENRMNFLVKEGRERVQRSS